MKELLKALSPLGEVKWRMLLAVVLTTVGSFLNMRVGQYISETIDTAIGGRIIVPWVGMLFAFAGFVTLSSCSKWIMGRAFLCAKSILYRRNDEALLHADTTELDKNIPGDLLNRCNDDTSQLEDALSALLSGSIATGLQMIVLLLILLPLCWPLAIFCFVYPVAYNVLFMFVSRTVKERQQTERQQMGEAAGIFEDALAGYADIRLHNAEDAVLARLRDRLEAHDATNRSLNSFWAKVGFGDSFISLSFPLLILTLGLVFVSSGQLTLGSVFLFLRFAPYFVNFIWDVDPQAFRRAAAAAKRVIWLWDLPRERENGARLTPLSKSPVAFADHVWFSYPGAQKPTVSDFSLTIRRGESIGIVGRSGSGKTTLLRLLCGFSQPQLGQLHLFGHPVEDWELSALREGIGYMQQTTHIYRGSLLSNVMLGNGKGNVRENMRYVSELLKEMELDAPLLGDRDHVGRRLSEGEKQRLAFARCRYKNADFFILDEPTSALDSNTEAQLIRIIERLHSQGNTLLIVTHRLPVVHGCDRIYVMEEGRIVESGSHEELMRMCGHYYRLSGTADGGGTPI